MILIFNICQEELMHIHQHNFDHLGKSYLRVSISSEYIFGMLIIHVVSINALDTELFVECISKLKSEYIFLFD